jgi:hypothetical protein
VPEYPGVYVDEVPPGKPIEGVSTTTKDFVGCIRRGAAAIVKGAAVFGIGVLLGIVAAVAVDKWRRRGRQVPPAP